MPMDPQKMMQDEAAELQMWNEVAQLAQTGSPDALAKIGQIAAQAIQAQEAEMKEIQGSQGGGMPQQNESGMDRLKAALIKRQQAGQPPQEAQPQE